MSGLDALAEETLQAVELNHILGVLGNGCGTIAGRQVPPRGLALSGPHWIPHLRNSTSKETLLGNSVFRHVYLRDRSSASTLTP